MSDDERRIFVGGLRYETEEAAVRQYFSQFGPIADVKIVKFPPPDNRSKGFGFVRFGSLAAKDHCMSESTHIIEGKTVELRHADPNHVSASASRYSALPTTGGPLLEPLDPENVAFRRLFVGNLDHSWQEDVLRQYFEQIGGIKELTIKRGPDGKCLGFAFITFDTAADVDRVQQSRPHSIQGRTLETRRQTPKQYVGTQEAKLQVAKIWIGAPEDEKGRRGHVGLGDLTTDEELEKYFTQFGVVTKVNQLMWPDSKKKRGYGYIEFADTDAVDKVVLSQIHIVNDTRLEVKKAIIRQPGEKSTSSAGGSSNPYGSMMGMSSMGGYNMGASGAYGGYGGMGTSMMDSSSMYGSGMSSMVGSGWGSSDINSRKRGYESAR